MAKRNPSMTIKAPGLSDGKIKVELCRSGEHGIDVLINGGLVACVYDTGSFHLVYRNPPVFNFAAAVVNGGGIEHTK